MLIEVIQQVGEDPHPGAVKSPTAEAVVDRLPWPIAGGDIAPGCTGVQTPENPIEELAMRLPWAPRLMVVLEVRKQVLNAIPPAIGDFVATWHG
jgi:hypothetical protein